MLWNKGKWSICVLCYNYLIYQQFKKLELKHVFYPPSVSCRWHTVWQQAQCRRHVSAGPTLPPALTHHPRHSLSASCLPNTGDIMGNVNLLYLHKRMLMLRYCYFDDDYDCIWRWGLTLNIWNVLLFVFRDLPKRSVRSLYCIAQLVILSSHVDFLLFLFICYH